MGWVGSERLNSNSPTCFWKLCNPPTPSAASFPEAPNSLKSNSSQENTFLILRKRRKSCTEFYFLIYIRSSLPPPRKKSAFSYFTVVVKISANSTTKAKIFYSVYIRCFGEIDREKEDEKTLRYYLYVAIFEVMVQIIILYVYINKAKYISNSRDKEKGCVNII
jgi:hypothetical protein